MNTPGLVKCAGALGALVVLTACGNNSTVAPSTAVQDVRYVGKTLFVNGRPVTAELLSQMPRYATIVPDHHIKNKYEYIFNNYETYGSIFDYPKGTQQIGTIHGAGGQGCTNVLYGYGKKYFWNVGGNTQITEYKVPQTRVKTLSVNYFFPSDSSGFRMARF